MNTNAQTPPFIFEVPEPPEGFGQDGGKFYKAYDAIAEEIDDDMTKSLKEQLDGMLIFAGLFAGVNSAFLALTLPLMSADPADDTNALLAQNNAILIQLVSGRNDSASLDTTLPSKSFAPSGAVLSVNILFALSLAFAIIASFLAVLGRQWLVYYRRRSGGGPDRQRWEQLKRFLGAERWGLELILDDILPSLLQTGRFRHARKEEDTGSLQIIAVQRTICTSEDIPSLLHATANILAITDSDKLKMLWDDETFRERMLELRESSYAAVTQPGEPAQSAASVARLYWCAATHISIHTKTPEVSSSWFFKDFGDRALETSFFSIPANRLANSSPAAIRSSSVCLALSTFGWAPFSEKKSAFFSYLDHCSRVNGRSIRFLSLAFWAITWCRRRKLTPKYFSRVLESLREAYLGDMDVTLLYLDAAFTAILDPKNRRENEFFGLTKIMLQCVENLLATEQAKGSIGLEEQFKLLGCCELALRNAKPQTENTETIQRIRIGVLAAVRELLPSPDRPYAKLVDQLNTYFQTLLTSDLQTSYPLSNESLDILESFAPLMRQVWSYPPSCWKGEWRDRWSDASTKLWEKRDATRRIFNTLVLNVDKVFCVNDMHVEAP
ncbi:hypothetical protein FRC01_005866 [Tulasnella sp. 417]|nr:hypothetical protein FRC01_005866 [Tulasnella sp. 417]